MAGIQGHVRTTTHDGQPLMILFLLDKVKDVEAIKKDLYNQVEVLRSFANAWNKGDEDAKGNVPLPESQPCDYLIVIKQLHKSTFTPFEDKHITVKLASQAFWYMDPPAVKGAAHVYSEDNFATSRYNGYLLTSRSLNKFGNKTWKEAIKTAMENDYEKET